MIEFVLGFFIGGALGVIILALIIGGTEGEDDNYD
jgi:hypothetical protein